MRRCILERDKPKVMKMMGKYFVFISYCISIYNDLLSKNSLNFSGEIFAYMVKRFYFCTRFRNDIGGYQGEGSGWIM